MCKKWEGKWKGKLVQLNPDFFNLSGRGKLAKLPEGLKNLGLCVTWKGKKVLIEIMGHQKTEGLEIGQGSFVSILVKYPNKNQFVIG